MKIAATVILYQPNDMVVNNIKTYADSVDVLYVVDNSERINKDIIAKIKMFQNVEYHAFDKNKGIAYALNYALKKSRKSGYSYLLTMDQDSKFEDGELHRYQKEAECLFVNNDKLIICGINHVKHKPIYEKNNIVDEVITSGMIVDIEKIIQIGGFLDKLFIDYVDYELCYRSYREGYECAMVNNCNLLHQIGSVNPVKKYGIYFNNHNEHEKVRMYYLIRNALYVMVNYNGKTLQILRNILKLIVKNLLVEDDKLNKFRYMYYGLRDFLHDNYGKFSLNKR